MATTVDLLTTGVDVPNVRNIVFLKYVRSAIGFHQMIGRGTRLDPATGKLMFRVYDYTNATRLWDRPFVTGPTQPPKAPPGDAPPPERRLEVEGFDVRITDAGQFIVTNVDGKATPVTLEEYREQVAAKLVEEAPNLDAFREAWVNPDSRRALLENLPEHGRSAYALQQLLQRADCDLYDVLAEMGYGLAPRTRNGRADAFLFKHGAWLTDMPEAGQQTVKALARQFAKGGTDELENQNVFATRAVAKAGGVAALREVGEPRQVLEQTKRRMFDA